MGWISIENLPKENCLCMVHNINQNCVHFSIFNVTEEEFTLYQDLCNHCSTDIFLSVTHYIVIPETPWIKKNRIYA